jgi:antibiotic biosynthesis monooxygenase (ABM) superfamily enzyme
MRHPGHLGVQVLRPNPGASPEWVVVIKFLTRDHYDAFRVCDEYTQWTRQLRELLEAEPVYEERTGLESWFVLPGMTSQPVLPKWKMALVTWIGVSIAVFALGIVVEHGPAWFKEWKPLPKQLVLNAIVVALLTWVIMPFLVRLLRPLLYPSKAAAPMIVANQTATPASTPSTSAG